MKIKKIVKRIIKTVIISVIILIIFLIISKDEQKEMSQYLYNIDYEVNVKENGSMNIIETWDIDISYTNTLFKTFELSNKYGKIDNVQVTDLINNIPLKKISNKMYHVTKDCYYGLTINNHQYEIAWGVGMDNKSGRRKYQISYTVNDVATDYIDCQEIYWQFLGKNQNKIPAEKVTGRINLPKNVSNIEELRVWGHGQINGKIEKANQHEIQFELNNLRIGEMIEIRVITQEKIFSIHSNNKLKGYRYLDNAITEETKWAYETNEKTKTIKKFSYILIVIYIIIIIKNIFQIKKCINLKKQKGDGLIKTNIEYYRDIPREKTSTPTEAIYLYNFEKNRLETSDVQREAITSTILDLCLKKKIELHIKEDKKVYLKVIGNSDGLAQDELAIYELLKDVGKEFDIEEIKKYAKTKYDRYSKSINKLVNSARNNLYKLKLVNKEDERRYIKYLGAETKFYILRAIYEWIVISNALIYIPLFKRTIITNLGINIQNLIWKLILILLPYIVIKLYLYNLQKSASRKIAVLTQKGSKEKEQWSALKKYLENYSLIKEKETLSLAVWEKYLVYGTAFGIADKIIKQMKAEYPEVFIQENWDEEKMQEKYPLINFVNNSIYVSDNFKSTTSLINNIADNLNMAYVISKTESAAHYSSGNSGGGGGFSDGGGGRWRRPDGMGGR